MYKYLLIRGLIVVFALAIVAGILLFLLGYFYRQTENRNFAELRKKAELDCTTMPYHCAIKEGGVEEISALKTSGADIDSRDRFGNTPLLYAISWNTSVVDRLLELGADPNIPNEQGLAPLQQSLNLDKYILAEKLVAHGANPDVKAEGDQKKYLTLLTYFITNKNQKAATFLVEHGASLNLKDGYGYTPCERVTMYENADLFPFCKKK
ncbi:MAG: ankyrin repeat domain-containing protein [Undibacterium sp.]